MRLLFAGDLGPSGFGTVTTDLGKELLALGVDVRFVSQNGLGELPEPFKSRTFVVNDQGSGWINDPDFTASGIIDGRYWDDGWSAERVLITSDPIGARLFTFSDEQTEVAIRETPTYHYCPIEGTMLPPSFRQMWDILRPVAMSEFGATEIERVTGTRPPVIYHGVDTTVFHPATPDHPLVMGETVLRSKDDAKRYFKIDPRSKIILRCDRNMPRKQYPSMLRALAPVLDTHPDAFVLIHNRTQDEGGNLLDSISHYPPRIASHIIRTGFIDRIGFFPRDSLVALYNAADVYASNSCEGFGLTIAEAMACGVPAVGVDFSAVPEVIGPGGLTVPVGGFVDNGYDHLWSLVDEPAFGTAVARLLDNPKERARLARRAPEHVRASFSWPTAARKFMDLMA